MKNASLKKNKFIYGLFISIPIFLGIILVLNYGINLPYWDDWSVVKLLEKYKNGALTLPDLWKRHNDHIIFFPNLVMLLSSVLTNANFKVQMLISQGMTAGMYIIWIKALHLKNRGIGEILVIGLLVYHCIQYGNFLWGFQVGFIMTASTMLMSVYCFERSVNTKKKKYTIGSLLAAFIASFSSMQGLLLWPVFVFYLCIARLRKEETMQKLVSFSTGLCVCFLLNLWGYNYSGVSAAWTVKELLFKGRFLLTLVGFPVTFFDLRLSFLVGIAVTMIAICTTSYVIYKKRYRELLFPIILMVLGYVTLILITLGRTEGGIEYILTTSRYTTFTLWIYLSLFYIFTVWFNKKMWIKILAILGLLFLVIHNLLCIRYWEGTREQRILNQKYMVGYEDVQLGDLYQIYPWEDYTSAYLDINLFRQLGHPVFSHQQGCFDETTLTYNTIDDKKQVLLGMDKNSIKLSQRHLYLDAPWLLVKLNSDIVQDVKVRINNKIYNAVFPIQRPDVAAVYGDQYLNSGFKFSKKLSELDKGLNRISIIIEYTDKTYTVTDTLEAVID